MNWKNAGGCCEIFDVFAAHVRKLKLSLSLPYYIYVCAGFGMNKMQRQKAAHLLPLHLSTIQESAKLMQRNVNKFVRVSKCHLCWIKNAISWIKASRRCSGALSANYQRGPRASQYLFSLSLCVGKRYFQFTQHSGGRARHDSRARCKAPSSVLN